MFSLVLDRVSTLSYHDCLEKGKWIFRDLCFFFFPGHLLHTTTDTRTGEMAMGERVSCMQLFLETGLLLMELHFTYRKVGLRVSG